MGEPSIFQKDYNKRMGKKYITVFLVLLILVLIGGVYYWKTKTQKSVTNTVPSISPTESTQSANPYDSTNPFSDIKVNPFE